MDTHLLGRLTTRGYGCPMVAGPGTAARRSLVADSLGAGARHVLGGSGWKWLLGVVSCGD